MRPFQYLIQITTPGLYPEEHFMSPYSGAVDSADGALAAAAAIWGERNCKIVLDSIGNTIARRAGDQ